MDDKFAYITQKYSNHEKFVVRWTITKQKEPAQHISLMMAGEYKTVPQTQLIKAMKKYTNVQYEITDMDVIPRREKTGRKFSLVVVRVKCDEIKNIRKMLNLKEMSNMRQHITLLEKELK